MKVGLLKCDHNTILSVITLSGFHCSKTIYLIKSKMPLDESIKLVLEITFPSTFFSVIFWRKFSHERDCVEMDTAASDTSGGQTDKRTDNHFKKTFFIQNLGQSCGLKSGGETHRHRHTHTHTHTHTYAHTHIRTHTHALLRFPAAHVWRRVRKSAAAARFLRCWRKGWIRQSRQKTQYL